MSASKAQLMGHVKSTFIPEKRPSFSKVIPKQLKGAHSPDIPRPLMGQKKFRLRNLPIVQHSAYKQKQQHQASPLDNSQRSNITLPVIPTKEDKTDPTQSNLQSFQPFNLVPQKVTQFNDQMQQALRFQKTNLTHRKQKAEDDEEMTSGQDYLNGLHNQLSVSGIKRQKGHNQTQSSSPKHYNSIKMKRAANLKTSAMNNTPTILSSQNFSQALDAQQIPTPQEARKPQVQSQYKPQFCQDRERRSNYYDYQSSLGLNNQNNTLKLSFKEAKQRFKPQAFADKFEEKVEQGKQAQMSVAQISQLYFQQESKKGGDAPYSQQDPCQQLQKSLNNAGPKQSYKRKRREKLRNDPKHYPQVLQTSNNNTQKCVENTSYQADERSPSIKINNAHISLGQAIESLKNQGKLKELPMTSYQTIEMLQQQQLLGQIQSSTNTKLPMMPRSQSQDIDQLNISVKTNSSKTNTLNREKGNNNSKSQLSKKIFDASELFEMAQQMKRQRIKDALLSSSPEPQPSKHQQLQDKQLIGALNIIKISQKAPEVDNNMYALRKKDVQLIAKYSKKSQNILHFDECVKGNGATIKTSRNTQACKGNTLTSDSQKGIISTNRLSKNCKMNLSSDQSLMNNVLKASSDSQEKAQQEQQKQPIQQIVGQMAETEHALITIANSGTLSTGKFETQAQKANTNISQEQAKQDTQEMSDKTDKTPNSQLQEQETIGSQFVQIKESAGNTDRVCPKSENSIKANNYQKGLQLPKIKRQGAATREDSFPFEDFKAKPQAQSNNKKIPVLMQDFNQEYQHHPINKTIQYISVLSHFMFKAKDLTNSQIEQANRCFKYFNITVPKQFRNDMYSYFKTKDCISQSRERIHATLSQVVNKSNLQSESLFSRQQGSYRYFIGTGNNFMLVKSIFKQRSWWIQAEKANFGDCNFIWTQWLKEKHTQALQPIDQHEGVLANTQDPQDQEQCFIRIYNKMQHNHTLSDKKHLFHNMRDYYQVQGIDPFLILPVTFVIDNGLNDPEFDKFEEHFRKLESSSQDSNASCKQNAWIVKPGENTNRGSGIIVTKDFSEIKALVRQKASNQDRTAIIQKYIENPLLINRRKFDIRCFGLLTNINGQMKGYFYQDSYFRTSSKEYSTNNLHNKYIHLTNDAIQKHSEDYGKFENANKLSVSDFDRYFESNGEHDVRFQRDFAPQIRKIIKDTFKAVDGKIAPEKRQNTFEIFGYDFMIDDKFKLQLIEVNTNPCLEVCCPLLARIIPSLLDSVFKVAIDPLFPPISKKGLWSGTEIISEVKLELIFESQK